MGGWVGGWVCFPVFTDSPIHLRSARTDHCERLPSFPCCQWPTKSSPCQTHNTLLLCSAPALRPADLAPTPRVPSCGPEFCSPDNAGTTASPCTGLRTWRTPPPGQRPWPPSTNAWRRPANPPGRLCCSTPDASGRRRHPPSPSYSFPLFPPLLLGLPVKGVSALLPASVKENWAWWNRSSSGNGSCTSTQEPTISLTSPRWRVRRSLM